MSRGWAKASACHLQVSLSCAVLCQIVFAPVFVQVVSPPLSWSPLSYFLVIWSPSGATRDPSVVFEAVDMPCPGPFHFSLGLSLASSFSLCQGRGAACNFFTASSASLFHPPLSPVFFFQSPSTPAFSTSLLTQSSNLSIGLPRLLLPCSRNSAALFGSLSSAILSMCSAHCNQLLTNLSVKLLCTPVSSLNSNILRVSALVTLAIFRTELFSHTCSLCCCSSVSAKVSVPYSMPNKHSSNTPCSYSSHLHGPHHVCHGR